ncbi:hypothetical protein M1M30_gp079 [Maribacter phage Colly_1]|uniref:Uncharacterized protein n=1 Tax=Maribacter phage Colly_1 TaxID=2745691 RepID=A0A8E4XZS5_9CAUD|nr:hypothetical protein M1M30_gp079 [Maribacter phage Colly_1]QQO97365.1 hypothetical protein Colly1_79 [Maribacter phage Colly_1]
MKVIEGNNNYSLYYTNEMGSVIKVKELYTNRIIIDLDGREKIINHNVFNRILEEYGYTAVSSKNNKKNLGVLVESKLDPKDIVECLREQ